MKTTIEILNVFGTFVFPVVAIVVTAFVLPWLRHKSTETKAAIGVAKTQEEAAHLQKVKANYDLLATWASAAVVAVGKLEQSGADKKAAAINLVQSQLDDHKIDINALNVANAIEAAYAKQVGVIDNAYGDSTPVVDSKLISDDVSANAISGGTLQTRDGKLYFNSQQFKTDQDNDLQPVTTDDPIEAGEVDG